MRRVMLSCLAQASTAALVALVLAAAATADTIKTFDVKGTAENVSHEDLGSCGEFESCSFSGTLMVDVTDGKVTTVGITFPGLSKFDTIAASHPFFANLWLLTATNLQNDSLDLDFTTTHEPTSLVDFGGGSIVGFGINDVSGVELYGGLSGSITSVSAAVPEPSSLELLGASLLGWVGFGLVRSRSKAALM